MTDAGHDLSAIAPGAAEPQVTRLQHHDVGDAFFGELQRGIDAGETAANDHDIGVHVLFQRGEAEVVFLGGRVIGGRFDIDHDAT